jgi:hypothetical protein
MALNVTAVVALGVGFAGGWAARSVADSPQGVGVKLMTIAMNANRRLGQWAAVEGERLEDMLEEARARVEPEAKAATPATKTNGAARKARMLREEA